MCVQPCSSDEKWLVSYLTNDYICTGTCPDEYIYYNNSWEKIGSTDIDLSNYWSMDNLVAITNGEIDTIVAQ